MVCKSYLGAHCIDVGCPVIFAERFPKYGYEGIHGCEECGLYDGCIGCVWENMNVCIKYKNNKRCVDIELD